MKLTNELRLPPTAYNADAQSASRALSKLEFQQLVKAASAQRPPVSKPAQQSAPLAAQAPRPSAPPPTAALPQFLAETFVSIKSGDTLTGIAKKLLEARGLDASPQAAMRAALRLARENSLSDPNLIVSGQKINVTSLQGAASGSLMATVKPGNTRLEEANKRLPSIADARSTQSATVAQTVPHPVLEKTLERAVSLQYFSAADKGAVRNKILDLAAEHRFNPDDLAVVTLLESDGMNPKASNGRCHGVIQFCDGSNRGAATVGFKNNPKAILDLPVLEQLDLVGKYFDETGLKNFGKNKPASLDDLYLTVLTPAARRERNINAYLDIAGQQANILTSHGETAAGITRKSLLQGLRQNAKDKLSISIPSPLPGPIFSTSPMPSKGITTSLIKAESLNADAGAGNSNL